MAGFVGLNGGRAPDNGRFKSAQGFEAAHREAERKAKYERTACGRTRAGRGLRLDFVNAVGGKGPRHTGGQVWGTQRPEFMAREGIDAPGREA